MSSYEAYQAFHGRLTAGWTTTDLVFENEFYELPDDPTQFVYVEVFGDTFDQQTAGAQGENMWLEQGVTYIHIMTPSGEGSGLARQYAGQIMNLFREQQVGGLRMPEMSVGGGDPGKDFPNYWALTLTIHWHRYDITDLT